MSRNYYLIFFCQFLSIFNSNFWLKSKLFWIIKKCLQIKLSKNEFLDKNFDFYSSVLNLQSLQRGKFFPQLTNLVRINTPKAVQTESRKAFRKLPNVEQAISTLTNLKGVGTTLASGLFQTLGRLNHDHSFHSLFTTHLFV